MFSLILKKTSLMRSQFTLTKRRSVGGKDQGVEKACFRKKSKTPSWLNPKREVRVQVYFDMSILDVLDSSYRVFFSRRIRMLYQITR